MHARLASLTRIATLPTRIAAAASPRYPVQALFVRMQQTGAPPTFQFPSADRVNVVDHVISRHRELETGLEQLHSETNLERKKELLNQVTHDLSVHAAVEELVLYSTIRRELGDSNPSVFSSEIFENMEEHHAAKAVLAELYRMGVESERFTAKAKVLKDNVCAHMKKEEESLLPELAKVWSTERLMQIGEEFRNAEKFAPTRPHPLLPDDGAMAAAASTVAGVVDRLRDAARDTLSSTSTTTTKE